MQKRLNLPSHAVAARRSWWELQAERVPLLAYPAVDRCDPLQHLPANNSTVEFSAAQIPTARKVDAIGRTAGRASSGTRTRSLLQTHRNLRGKPQITRARRLFVSR